MFSLFDNHINNYKVGVPCKILVMFSDEINQKLENGLEYPAKF